MENTAPAKLDLKKQLKHLDLPSAKEVTVVDVPEMKFIMVDGRIEPNATPRTAKPENLKSVLRHAVFPAE